MSPSRFGSRQPLNQKGDLLAMYCYLWIQHCAATRKGRSLPRVILFLFGVQKCFVLVEGASPEHAWSEES